MNRTVLNSTANSGPSVGASSLVTDANSALSGGPHLQRSASINTESYMRLPASPMSFSSNNISMSGGSALDGSSIVLQNSHQDQSSQQAHKRQHGASTASSQPTSRGGQVSLPTGSHIPSSSNQEAHYMSQMPKKPKLELKQEDIFQQQVMQQLLQRQDPSQLQSHNPQIQALIQQQRLFQRQQQPQQMLQTMPQMQRAQLQQQLQQQQLRQQVQQQSLQSVSGVKRPYESGVCARRLMQYIYHQRHRPSDNSIAYWRKFAAEYFSPRAKKRWCLSLYENVGQHALGVFPQVTMDAWQCDICGSKSGKGFEATFEVLPRLNKVKFDSGVIDELLYLDMPRECRFPSGILMLEYGKAIQESVFDQLRVIREGHLRIIFSPDLKILSWEFCARRHEELLPRRLVAPQVNQLLQVAQKYQNAVTESGSAGISTQDLQSNWNMFLTAGRQLARNMELPLLNDLGFSKRYVRCLQISEVVNSMKDLIDFSDNHKIGPIESLKSYPRLAPKFPMQNKVMSLAPPQTGSYQNLLRQSSMNANPNLHQQQESPSPYQSQQVSSSSSSNQQNQNVQQHMIQQLLHEMMNNGGRAQQQAQQSVSGNSEAKGIVGNNGGVPNRNNNNNDIKGVTVSGNTTTTMTNTFGMKASCDITQNLHLPEIDGDITNEFPDWDM